MQVLEAVNDFLLTYAENLKQDNLFWGYQNNMALPPHDNYVVISVTTTRRIGTNITDYDESEQSIYGISTLREYVVAIDFCNEDYEPAMDLATRIETIATSAIGVKFFKEKGMSLAYCEDAYAIPFIGVDEDYIQRFRVSLHITNTIRNKVKQEYAEEVNFDNEKSRIENVDVHHKPK